MFNQNRLGCIQRLWTVAKEDQCSNSNKITNNLVSVFTGNFSPLKSCLYTGLPHVAYVGRAELHLFIGRYIGEHVFTLVGGYACGCMPSEI